MKRQIVFAIVASSLLAACATPYQEVGLSSGVMGLMGGVQASRLDETTIQVSARGNAYTNADTITRYALRKAAEETVAAGYDGFYVASDQDRTRRIEETSFSGSTIGPGFSGSGTTTYTLKPGQALTVKMFKGPKPSNAPGVYDARELLRFLVPPIAAK